MDPMEVPHQFGTDGRCAACGKTQGEVVVGGLPCVPELQDVKRGDADPSANVPEGCRVDTLTVSPNPHVGDRQPVAAVPMAAIVELWHETKSQSAPLNGPVHVNAAADAVERPGFTETRHPDGTVTRRPFTKKPLAVELSKLQVDAVLQHAADVAAGGKPRPPSSCRSCAAPLSNPETGEVVKAEWGRVSYKGDRTYHLCWGGNGWHYADERDVVGNRMGPIDTPAIRRALGALPVIPREQWGGSVKFDPPADAVPTALHTVFSEWKMLDHVTLQARELAHRAAATGTDRRVRLAFVSREAIADLFDTIAAADAGGLGVFDHIIPQIPKGSKVVGVNHFYERGGWVLTVWHPSFDPVPPGLPIPYLPADRVGSGRVVWPGLAITRLDDYVREVGNARKNEECGELFPPVKVEPKPM